VDEHRDVNEAMGGESDKLNFVDQRFITIGYYALVDYSKLQVSPSGLSDASEWMDVSALPKLFLDHNRIVIKALESLNKKNIAADMKPVQNRSCSYLK
jgi:hypothetical protein